MGPQGDECDTARALCTVTSKTQRSTCPEPSPRRVNELWVLLRGPLSIAGRDSIPAAAPTPLGQPWLIFHHALRSLGPSSLCPVWGRSCPPSLLWLGLSGMARRCQGSGESRTFRRQACLRLSQLSPARGACWGRRASGPTQALESRSASSVARDAHRTSGYSQRRIPFPAQASRRAGATASSTGSRIPALRGRTHLQSELTLTASPVVPEATAVGKWSRRVRELRVQLVPAPTHRCRQGA